MADCFIQGQASQPPQELHRSGPMHKELRAREFSIVLVPRAMLALADGPTAPWEIVHGRRTVLPVIVPGERSS